MERRFGIRLGDIILMAVILLTAVLLLALPLLSERAQTAEIVIAETGEITTVSLNEDASYEIASRGVTLTVRVSGGGISVSESDCRDSVCRNTPPISRAGQSIVCAPAGVVVRIRGEGGAVDGVSG